MILKTLMVVYMLNGYAPISTQIVAQDECINAQYNKSKDSLYKIDCIDLEKIEKIPFIIDKK